MNNCFGGAKRDWAMFATLFGGIAVVAVLVMFSRRDTYPRISCMNNMSQLAQLFVIARQENRIDPTLHGAAQILSWGGVRNGDERVFFCPADGLDVPTSPAERRPFHPADANELRRTRGLGSYAVRDFETFPLDDASMEKQMILCDRQGDDGRTMHHKNVIIVGYAFGDAEKLTAEELGFRPGEPIVVGPDSPNAELRKMERP